MFPILETERLILRELVEADAQAILDCFSNPDVLRYYGQIPLTSCSSGETNYREFCNKL